MEVSQQPIAMVPRQESLATDLSGSEFPIQDSELSARSASTATPRSSSGRSARARPEAQLLPNIMLSEDRPVIAVIGAGLAGLAAAHEARKLGLYAEVFEAHPSRIGGRVLTEHTKSGALFELGAEVVDDGYIYLRRLVQEAGLSLKNIYVPGEYAPRFTFDVGGLRYSQSDFAREIKPFVERVACDLLLIDENDSSSGSNLARRIDLLSVEEYINSIDLTPWARQSLTILVGTEMGAHPSKISALTLLGWGFEKMSDEAPSPMEPGYGKFIISGGASALVRYLASQVDDQIHLDVPLRKISRKEGKFELALGQAKTFIADRVIFAVPFSVLRDVEIESGIISESKMDLIRGLGYGDLQKTVSVINSPSGQMASGTIVSSSLRGFLWGIRPSLRDTESAHISALQSRSLLSTEPADQNDMHAFEPRLRALGISTPFSIAEHRTKDWLGDPFTKGSYAVLNPGNGLRVEEIAEAADEGRILFAGEHTSPHPMYIGTMEGAVASGVFAARRLWKELLRS